MATNTKTKTRPKTSARRARPPRKDGWITLYSPKMGREFKVAAREAQVRKHGMPLDPDGNKMTAVLKQ